MQLAYGKPRVIVIGLGAYFRKLRKGIHRYFEIAQLVDSESSQALNLAPDERESFRKLPKTLRGLTVGSSVDCLVLLTPPAFHVPHIEIVAKFQKPMLVEKPLATAASEISRLEQAVMENPRLYCSDFYPDVRAVPLLQWFNPHVEVPLRSKIQLTSGDRRLWTGGVASMGAITRIEGKLLEGSGSARGFEGREWLWEPSQGGVVRDLMSHYFTLSSYLFNDDLIPRRVILQTWRSGRKELDWHPRLGLADTYALVEGELQSGIPFSFEVAKYWKAGTERRFTIYFSDGSASMHFKDRNVLILQCAEAQCEATLQGNYYDHVVKLFHDYVRSGVNSPHGLDHAIRSVRQIDDILRRA